ncbi:MAG: hypothetical protein ACRCX2_32450 [Paraclostridium sp.]
MKITIEFEDVNEYLEFKEKTAQEVQVQEQVGKSNLEQKIVSTITKDFREAFRHKSLEPQ